VYLLNGLDRVKVINSWVQTDLVHNCDSCILALLIKLQHSRRDIRSGNDVFQLSYSRFDNGSMIRVWDQTDDQVVLCDLSIEGLLIANIERYWVGKLNTFGELFCRFEIPTC
jgi:hypothetical protein